MSMRISYGHRNSDAAAVCCDSLIAVIPMKLFLVEPIGEFKKQVELRDKRVIPGDQVCML